MLTIDLIDHILATIRDRAIGVLGDLFLDRYLDIDPALNEPSVETGLIAYQVVRVRNYPGAAGTVMNNLMALGVGRIYPITVIGDDGEGYDLRQALRVLPAIADGGIMSVPNRRTPTYTKPMFGTEELNRLDIKNRTPTPDDVQERIMELLDQAWPQFDALLVLDQVSEEDCGVVTARVRDHLAKLARADPSKFVLADSRERIERFRNVCIKPNERECVAAYKRLYSGRELVDGHPASVLHEAVGRLVFCTRGDKGILLAGHEPAVDCVTVAAYPVTGRIDTCGAGDSCSAGIACATISGATPVEAAAFGNLVASITIQQIGVTGTASPAQVRARWREVQQT